MSQSRHRYPSPAPTNSPRNTIACTLFPWAVRLVDLFFQPAVFWLSMLFEALDMVSCNLWALLATVLRSPPSESYCIEDSAILVVSVDDGIGRRVTMKLSELGYTVFAFCPDADRNTPSTFARSSVASSLLYTWHLKRERSPHHPWGVLVPISLETSLKSDRVHAYETIEAYCSKHSLHLVSLIVLPPPLDKNTEHVFDVQLGESCATITSQQISCKHLPISLAREGAWEDIVSREVTEPVLVVRDYVRLLKQSLGRIIFVSGYPDIASPFGSELVLPLGGSRRAIALALSHELEPLGIKVASIVSGPVASIDVASPNLIELDRRNMCSKQADPETIHAMELELSVRQLFRRVFHSFEVNEDKIHTTITRILRSRHPKFDYTVGLYPHMQSLVNVALSTLRLLIRNWV